jgi:cytochrome c oxidase assembly protein subunit 11
MDKNARIAWTLVLVTAGMLGMAYAAVPLYQAFCRATGFAGTPLVAQSDDRPVISRTVKVRFDTNVDPGLAWRFEPEQRQVTVHLGEEKLVYFRATNLSQRPIVGAANYNVTPERTAGWFNKIQCFCFTEQLLKPGQSVDMPVIFFVDSDMAKDRAYDDINTITLSYTFHEAKTPHARELLRGASADESGKGS